MICGTLVHVPVGMEGGKFAKEFSHLQIKLKGCHARGLDQRFERSGEAIQCPEPHDLFKLKPAHCVDAESPASHLEDKFLATCQHLTAKVADKLSKCRRSI